MRSLILAILFIFSLNLFSQEIDPCATSANHWYLGLVEGVSFKNPSKASGYYKSFDAGPITGIFGGYDANLWKVELQISDRENPVNHEVSAVNTAKTAEEWALTFMGNAYYLPFQWKIVRPYLGTGLGYALHSYAWHVHNPLLDGEYINFTHVRKYSNGFTYQVMLGLEWLLSDRVNLDLEYAFWVMPWIHYGGFTGYDKVSTHLSSNLLLIKLTYKFP